MSAENLIAALAAAQAEFPTIPKNRVAKVKTDKASYSYRYADLSDILGAVTPVLNRHGLAIMQKLEAQERGTLLITELCHAATGERERSSLMLPAFGGSPQTWASACTYGKRYALTALLGIVADEDDDGEMAEDDARHRAPPRQQQRPQARSPADEALLADLRIKLMDVGKYEGREMLDARDWMRSHWRALGEIDKDLRDELAAALNDRAVQLGITLKEAA